jgi:hypothetical protein
VHLVGLYTYRRTNLVEGIGSDKVERGKNSELIINVTKV